MSRTVNGERIFGSVDQEAFRKQLWVVADYCGVEILTWTILSNHFHVLLRVPRYSPTSDEELLRRYRVLYPRPTKFQLLRLEVIRGYLASEAPEGAAWRKRQLAQMGDVSAFMKILKQRYSIWFNNHHRRFGTLWSERFKSVLVESGHRVVEAMGAYIDLNCVRAGICDDPKDYRFCGYAEAVAGSVPARGGLCSLLGAQNWDATHASYRQLLFAIGAGPREQDGNICESAFQTVRSARGELPIAAVLRCKLKFFTAGAVLGRRAFVEEQLLKFKAPDSSRGKRLLPTLPALSNMGDLVALRLYRGATQF